MDFGKLKLSGVKLYETDGKLYAETDQSGINARYVLSGAFDPPAKVVLCDLDGTTVKSEEFWIYLIEKTVKRISGDPDFNFSAEDVPFVSGYTTLQHLDYCIKKFGLKTDVHAANKIYHAIANDELKEITEGRGNVGAFKPRECLKEFFEELKGRKIKIGLVTSGLEYKAIPEILSVFRVLKMGDPFDYYDAIITGGNRKIKGNYGTIGEMAAKPHPWLYAEIGVALAGDDKASVITLEDSTSGLISSLAAGYSVIGFNDGNIISSGARELCFSTTDSFNDVLKKI